MKKDKILMCTFLVIISICIFKTQTSIILAKSELNKINKEKVQVKYLDKVEFDGKTMKFTYTLLSKCPAKYHTPSIELNTNIVFSNGKKQLDTIKVVINDTIENSIRCVETAYVQINSSINLYKLIKEKTDELTKEKVYVGDYYAIILPQVRISSSKDEEVYDISSIAAPYDGSDEAYEEEEEEEEEEESSKSKKFYSIDDYFKTPDERGKVKVTRKFYTSLWYCQLWKRDGSKKDGFDGYGKTLEEARNESIRGCKRTNNPKCAEFAVDPQHTECKFSIKEEVEEKEYSEESIALLRLKPTQSQWTCYFYDKTTGDKITSSSHATQESAINDLIKQCNKEKLYGCEEALSDSLYRVCNGSMYIEEPKPKLRWKCILFKKDGSKRDGFEGVGDTEFEARNQAAKQCQYTNNPRCFEFSTDPNHTTCNMETVYD